MKTFLIAFLSFSFSITARAAGDLCTDAVSLLVKSKKFSASFTFDSSMKKLAGASKFDLGNERMASETKDKLKLEILKQNERISRYTVTQQVNCEKHCEDLQLILDVDYSSGECKVTNAQYAENLMQRTLFNRAICQELAQKSRLQFATDHPDWIAKFKIRKKISESPQDLLRQIGANCKAYKKYYQAGASESPTEQPTKASGSK